MKPKARTKLFTEECLRSNWRNIRQISDEVVGEFINRVDAPTSEELKDKKKGGGTRGQGGFGNIPTSQFEVVGHDLQAMKQVMGNIGSQLTDPGTWKGMWRDVQHSIPAPGVNPGRPGIAP